MPLANAVLLKMLAGTASAALLAGGTTVVAIRSDRPSAPRQQEPTGAPSFVTADDAGATNTEIVVDPVTGTAMLATRADSGAGAAGGASARGRLSAPGERRGSSDAGTTPLVAGGQSGAGGTGSAAGGGASAGATITVPNGSASGPGSSPGSGGSGGSGGSSPGTSPGGDGDSGATPPSGPGGPGLAPVPSAPTVNVPATPSRASAHSEGTYTLTVPGTDRMRKKLCVTGTVVNECQTVTVPAVKPIKLTVAYAGHAGAEAPKFTPATCTGGMSVKVSGLTPGATLTLTVEGTRVSAKVPERSAHQTASLCDA